MKMANITADMVKDLRDKTGAGMMDCKRALAEAGGDIEKAIENLRKSGIAKAEKKSGRATKEGKIMSLVDGGKGVMIEVLCETDFVAKNEKFLEFVKGICQRALAAGGNGDVSEKVQEAEKENLVSMIATIGENMQIRRAARWESAGCVSSYLHMGGRIGILVDAEGDCSDKAFMSDVCMHIAAFKPQFVDSGVIPADVIEKEKEIATAQVQGKPAQVVEKIVSGKINKWFSEVCLMKQPWIKDDKSCLEKVKAGLKVKRFLRWEVGEEI